MSYFGSCEDYLKKETFFKGSKKNSCKESKHQNMNFYKFKLHKLQLHNDVSFFW